MECRAWIRKKRILNYCPLPLIETCHVDRVKELIDEVVEDRSHVNGDAHNLEELYIGDLHPTSWYISLCIHFKG
jgi:hypothetical protein